MLAGTGVSTRFYHILGLRSFRLRELSGLGAWMLWGDSITAPFTLASERPSTLLSIFRFLRGEYSPLPWTWRQATDTMSVPCIAIGGGLLFAAHLYRRFPLAEAAVLATSVTLALYKVGHQQFFILLYLLTLYWWTDHAHLRKSTIAALLVFYAFLNTYSVGMMGLGKYNGEWSIVKELVGLPFFLLLTWLFWSVYREARGGWRNERCSRVG